MYRGVLISGCWNRGVPLYTEVSSFQGVGIEEFHCIQRCSRVPLYAEVSFCLSICLSVCNSQEQLQLIYSYSPLDETVESSHPPHDMPLGPQNTTIIIMLKLLQ